MSEDLYNVEKLRRNEEIMNYIWEIVIDQKKDIFFKQARSFSPYYEVSPDYINEREKEPDTVELNSLYRFDDIFSPLFAEGISEEEWKTYLFNSCMHFLIHVDLKSGITVKEMRVRRAIYDIEHANYGIENQRLFAKLKLHQKYTLANHLIDQNSMGESVTLFAKALMELLETGIVYKNSIQPKELLIYLGEKKNEEYSVLIQLAEQFFLPLDYSIRVFWDNHFALMDINQTLRYERIEIF